MSLLARDGLSRGTIAPRQASAFSLRLPMLFFLSLALIALSRLDHPAIKELRAEAEAVVAPALGTAMLPLDPARRLISQIQSSYDGFAELERLKAENQQLRQWEIRARDLERKLGELGALSQSLEQQRIDFRTVRVIATSSGGFQHSALLEAGTEHGVRIGQPVINAGGLLGRIVEAGRRTSRVLLLTDINSRVPVTLGPEQVRAVLAGDNGPSPRLVLLPQGVTVADGDEILTSGIGGMFPRSMRIGTVERGATGLRAALSSRLGNLEYVSVLMLDNPDVALTRELRSPEQPAGRRGVSERGARQ